MVDRGLNGPLRDSGAALATDSYSLGGLDEVTTAYPWMRNVSMAEGHKQVANEYQIDF